MFLFSPLLFIQKVKPRILNRRLVFATRAVCPTCSFFAFPITLADRYHRGSSAPSRDTDRSACLSPIVSGENESGVAA